MFSLLPREQALIVFILAATLLGFSVKHWRDTRREISARERTPPAALQPPLAGRGSGR